MIVVICSSWWYFGGSVRGLKMDVTNARQRVRVNGTRCKRVKSLHRPGVEPGMSRPQREVLTTILPMPGEAGYRSLYLPHAKRALYHLSYIPIHDISPPPPYHHIHTSTITFPHFPSMHTSTKHYILPITLHLAHVFHNLSHGDYVIIMMR